MMSLTAVTKVSAQEGPRGSREMVCGICEKEHNCSPNLTIRERNMEPDELRAACIGQSQYIFRVNIKAYSYQRLAGCDLSRMEEISLCGDCLHELVLKKLPWVNCHVRR